MKKFTGYLLFGLLVATPLLYQNCGQVKFQTNNEKVGLKDIEEVECTAGSGATASCADKKIFFVGGVGQATGNTISETDGLVLTNFNSIGDFNNSRHSKVRVFIDSEGKIEVHTAAGYYPWICLKHPAEGGPTQSVVGAESGGGVATVTSTNIAQIDISNIRPDTQGIIDVPKTERARSNGSIAADQVIYYQNCYSSLRWYSDDGQQGFAIDNSGAANSFQKNIKGEVFARATPDGDISGVPKYLTEMVLLPPDRYKSDGSRKDLIWVYNNDALSAASFAASFTTHIWNVWPYANQVTDFVKVYGRIMPGVASGLGIESMSQLLIERSQLELAKTLGYDQDLSKTPLQDIFDYENTGEIF